MKEHYSLPGYHPAFRHDRDVEKKGGGVMLLVKENLYATKCTELSKTSFDEAIWCVVHLSRAEKLIVRLCYRSPNSSKENNEKLRMMVKQLEAVKARNILLMGDFNFPNIEWEDGYVEGSDESEAAMFFDATQSSFLHQHVMDKTRYREGFVPSRLDLIFSNKEYLVEDLLVCQPLGKSDHVVLTWKCMYKQTPPVEGAQAIEGSRYNFRKGRYQEMKQKLSELTGKF